MNNDDNAPRPTTVTVAEGTTIRIYEQTASRDYTANVVPGTYPLSYTDSRYNTIHDDARPYYVLAKLLIDTPDRRESSAEFGGVALAHRDVQGERTTHIKTWYNYEVMIGQLGNYTFA